MKEDYSDNQLKDIFKSKFAEEFIAPPTKVWNQIEKQMAQPGRIRKPLYFWMLPLGLIVLLSGGIVLNSLRSKSKTKETANHSVLKEKSSFHEHGATQRFEKKPNSTIDRNDKLSKKINFTATSNEPVKNGKTEWKKDLNSRLNEKTSARKLNRRLETTFLEKNRKEISSAILENESAKKAHQIVAENGVNSNTYWQGKSQISKSSTATEDKSKISPIPSKAAALNNNTAQEESGSRSDEPAISTENNDKQIVESNHTREANGETPNFLERTENTKDEFLKTQRLDSTAQSTVSDNIDSSAFHSVNLKQTVPLVSEVQFKKIRFDVYAGFGRSPRKSSFSGTNTSLVLTDKIVRIKNKTLGMNVRYQLTPNLGIRTGASLGINRYRTRFFPVKLANSELNKDVEVTTADGIMRATGLENNGLPSNNVDSSSYVMRVFHRSSYFALPLSIYLNSTMKPNKLYFYGMTGIDITVRGRERSLLQVKTSEGERDVVLRRTNQSNQWATNWHVAFGMSYPFRSNFELFSELNYALNFNNSLKNSNANTKYSYLQMVIGLRF